VARRGAREVTREREAEPGQRRDDTHDRRRAAAAPPRQQADWVREDGARSEWADDAPRSRAASGSSGKRRPTPRPAGPPTTPGTRTRPSLPPEIATEIRNAADAATALHKEHLVEKAEAAYGAYERDRFLDALRAIKPVADEAPRVAAVRELAGLAAYRLGRWREAARHLQAFDQLSDATEHLPVLMDIQRALHKPKKVAELWAELRHRSPDPDVLAEGRIVAAASLAETGDLNGAISMLASAGASKSLRNPSPRHVRQWYLLADLYERAGDVPRAREFFERVQRVDPEAYDVAERLRALGPERRPRGSASRSAGARPRPTR
jgi:tetratricopeptide (TPR) repeat protein